ncbi:hypothetical protein Smp_138720 [Schistosoma mansoni]|uniref:MPN domain-containing protein n=1 Tax=Schistosoma mansoni TaxID=6183 RepID=G4LW45_SCHMA|nr:hypothetical protein Smp_138720 [Schistosoma mansoni]|eukprot:XP_018645492.1 hypothetical protein Smp_138720 [Schistosoma mansoni]
MPTVMTSNYTTIPMRFHSYLGVYDEDQVEKDKLKTNSMIELEECIGSESIGFRAKLNYLNEYCDAANLHCAILEPEIDYHQALKPFEETFGQKHLIALTFMDNLLNFPNIRRNQPDGLRKLSREMQAYCLTLEQMNHVSDLNSTRTIETMVSKLPTHV